MENNNAREEAVKWFDEKSALEKTRLCDTNTEIVGHVRRWESLTEWEKEAIYKAEESKEDRKMRTAYQSADMQDYENKTGVYAEKNEDWDLYPGNEAGAFDHLDHDPGTFPLDIPGMDDEEREIEKLEADLWNQPTGTPPISTPENDGYILFSLKRPSAGKIKYWHDGEKTGTYDVEMDIVIELGRLPKMWKPMPLEQVTPKVVSFK